MTDFGASLIAVGIVLAGYYVGAGLGQVKVSLGLGISDEESAKWRRDIGRWRRG